jgi:hypothetical protein
LRRSSRKYQLCLVTPYVGKETLQIQDAGRYLPPLLEPRPAPLVVTRKWPVLKLDKLLPLSTEAHRRGSATFGFIGFSEVGLPVALTIAASKEF